MPTNDPRIFSVASDIESAELATVADHSDLAIVFIALDEFAPDDFAKSGFDYDFLISGFPESLNLKIDLPSNMSAPGNLGKSMSPTQYGAFFPSG